MGDFSSFEQDCLVNNFQYILPFDPGTTNKDYKLLKFVNKIRAVWKMCNDCCASDIVCSNEGHFWLNKYIDKQNYHICSNEQSHT